MQFSQSFKCAYMQLALRSFIVYNLRTSNSCFLDFSALLAGVFGVQFCPGNSRDLCVLEVKTLHVFICL